MQHDLFSRSARTAIAVSIVALLLGSCAAGQIRPSELPREGEWSFTGVVQSTHVMRNGSQPIIVPIHGVLEFRPDIVAFSGSHGNCIFPRESVMSSSRRLQFTCGEMAVRLTPTRGEVTLPIDRDFEQRAECVRYRTTDPRDGCLEWSWQVRTVRVNVSTRVQVQETVHRRADGGTPGTGTPSGLR